MKKILTIFNIKFAKLCLIIVLTIICQLLAISLLNAQQVIGITNAGGDFGFGATYSYDAVTGKDSLLFNFGGVSNSIMLGNPQGNVIQATNGKLYGLGYVGGNYNYGGLFSYDPVTGKDSVLLSFDGYAKNPRGTLIQASNGWLYGTTQQGGFTNTGVMFCYNPFNGHDSIALDFIDSLGSIPCTSLIQLSNGLLFGMTSSGGAYGKGAIYSYNPVTGKDSLRYSLNDSSGSQPIGGLIQASNGLLYGMTGSSGRYGLGAMICFNPVTNHDSVLFYFNWANGAATSASLMQASNGLLYGMTTWGGIQGQGIAFAYNPITGKDSIVIQFNGPNGEAPLGTLIQASDGFLYGMTSQGGLNGEGVIFRYDPVTGKDSVLVNMSGLQNGDSPDADLFQASNGLLYGMTSLGGSSGTGTLFRLNPVTLNDSILLNFGVSSANTQNAPIQASDGMLYGMTYGGGTYDRGTLFKYNPVTGKDTVLLNFSDPDASNPGGSLIQASNGLLYGLTSYLAGSLFCYNPVTYKDSILVAFDTARVQNPVASLIQASDGLLYGTVSGGGDSGMGVMFNYNPVTGKYSTLHTFYYADGGSPYCTLTEGANQVLYGTTFLGGANKMGVLFSYDIVHAKYDTLVSLNDSCGNPLGNLIVDTAMHMIYGASNFSVPYIGSMFSYNLNSKTLKVPIQFNIGSGSGPTGVLMWDTAANNIYGSTYNGGNNNYGVLFRYNTVTQQDTVLYNFQDSLVLSHRHHGPGHAITVGVNPSGIMLKRGSSPNKVNNIVAKKETISVYPNPASTNATVVFSTAGKHYLQLNDVKGRELRNITCSGNLYNLNCSELAAGVYFITSHDDGQKFMATVKIVVE